MVRPIPSRDRTFWAAVERAVLGRTELPWQLSGGGIRADAPADDFTAAAEALGVAYPAVRFVRQEAFAAADRLTVWYVYRGDWPSPPIQTFGER